MTGATRDRRAVIDQGSVVETLAELAELAVFQVDVDRRILAFSPEAERITGFSAEEVVGEFCLKAIRCANCLKECGVFDRGEVRAVPMTLYRKDGSKVEVLKSGRVLRDAETRVVGAVEVLRLPGDDAHQSRYAGAAHEVSGRSRERERIRAALEEARYQRTKAARLLGMSRTTLWRKMKELGLDEL